MEAGSAKGKQHCGAPVGGTRGGRLSVGIAAAAARLGRFPAGPARNIRWLGVVPYLSHQGFSATFDFLSACAPGSVLVMDYGVPRESLPFHEQLAFDSLAARVAAAGEPFQLFFTPGRTSRAPARTGLGVGGRPRPRRHQRPLFRRGQAAVSRQRSSSAARPAWNLAFPERPLLTNPSSRVMSQHGNLAQSDLDSNQRPVGACCHV